MELKLKQNLAERVRHRLFKRGLWRKRITTFQATAMIVGSTIGAGILGIPYAVAEVGFLIGVFYIIAIGLLATGVNLMVGEVSTRTVGSPQLVGLSKKYLGDWGKWLMMGLFYLQAFAILTVYIIGNGEILTSFFGGTNLIWSLFFWVIGSVIVYGGLEMVKKTEVILTVILVGTVFLIAGISLPHIQTDFYLFNNIKAFFLPYGVILFSFSGVASIPAAYRLLHGQNKVFKNAIILSSLISIAIYLIFVTVVLGITGVETTEIATLGLGEALGKAAFYFTNIFAFLAMSTSFLMIGMQLRDSLNWDFSFSYKQSNLIALLIPMLIFILGIRQFILAINLTGGILMSIQMFMMVAIYWRAKRLGDVDPENYVLRNTFLISSIALIAFALGAVYSLLNVFNG